MAALKAQAAADTCTAVGAMLHEACSRSFFVLSSRSNIEVVARDICTRLYAQDWPRGPELDADVDRHWHIVAAMLEAGLMDETGSNTLPYDFDREIAAVRDWRARHPDYVIAPPSPRPKS